jgi:hypothetical protein
MATAILHGYGVCGGAVREVLWPSALGQGTGAAWKVFHCTGSDMEWEGLCDGAEREEEVAAWWSKMERDARAELWRVAARGVPCMTVSLRCMWLRAGALRVSAATQGGGEHG